MNPVIRHMTHIRNLAPILEQGGLWCDTEAVRRGLTQQGIGHSHLKKRRERRAVKVGPGGFVCDYVPFYFAHHTPMLYAIHRGGVEGYRCGQGEVIYLVSKVSTIQQNGLPFVFTDGSAVVEVSGQFTDPALLDTLDWPTIRANFWKNTNIDGDRERRKQAEFLVHEFLPWSLIGGIAVRTQEIAEQVAAVLEGHEHSPPVRVVPAWYY